MLYLCNDIYGTKFVGGWSILLAARIFSMLWVMVVTQILESLIYCIPRYRDYSTAEIDCGFFYIFLISCFRVLKINPIVLLYCPDMGIHFGVIPYSH